MKLYMAPMEGLTGYVYRGTYHRHFGGADRYFTPFITNKKLNHREINDIMPEHNAGMDVVPQILTNRAEDFLCITKELRQYGYCAVNLNLGCPSGTVVAKNRGAGFLALPDELDRFLGEIFDASPLDISIKTRIGKESPAEWECLLSIYEKYPLKELIIHPRVQRDFYKNKVNLEAFALGAERSGHPLCYNGDICTVDDYLRIKERFPGVQRVMLGRGLLRDPGLLGAIRRAERLKSDEARDAAGDGSAWDGAGAVSGVSASLSCGGARQKERLRAFHDDLLHGYVGVMSGDKPVLFKMKELWVYLAGGFTEPEKYIKKIRKTEHIREYVTYVDALFREQEWMGHRI